MIRALLFVCLAGPVSAESVIASRTIRPQTIIGPGDIEFVTASLQGAADHPDLVVGMEARVALYAGRPIAPGDVGPPAIIDRNDIVPLVYSTDTITIETEGRALGRGGAGDRIRVMNLDSRTTVTARIDADGAAYVSN